MRRVYARVENQSNSSFRSKESGLYMEDILVFARGVAKVSEMEQKIVSASFTMLPTGAPGLPSPKFGRTSRGKGRRPMIAKGSRVRIMSGPYEGHDGTVLDEVGAAGFSFSRGGPSIRVRLDGSGTSVSLVLFDLKEFPARANFKSDTAGATPDAA